MKAYWGNGGIDSLILDRDTGEKCMPSLTPLPLCHRQKRLHFSLDRRLSGLKAVVDATEGANLLVLLPEK
jgi:hypothetical protein